MNTPPKDKPISKDKESPAEKDELQSDEAVSAPDLETEKETHKEDPDTEENSADDLNIDNTQVGLNNEQGEEFL